MFGNYCFRLMLWSLNPISDEWSEANLIFKVLKNKTKRYQPFLECQPTM